MTFRCLLFLQVIESVTCLASRYCDCCRSESLRHMLFISPRFPAYEFRIIAKIYLLATFIEVFKSPNSSESVLY